MEVFSSPLQCSANQVDFHSFPHHLDLKRVVWVRKRWGTHILSSFCWIAAGLFGSSEHIACCNAYSLSCHWKWSFSFLCSRLATVTWIERMISLFWSQWRVQIIGEKQCAKYSLQTQLQLSPLSSPLKIQKFSVWLFCFVVLFGFFWVLFVLGNKEAHI